MAFTAGERNRLHQFGDDIGRGDLARGNMGQFSAVVDSIASGQTDATPAQRRRAKSMGDLIRRKSQ